jgi:four helix bundle protein
VAVKTYRDLIEWQRAMDLAEAVYKATEHLPRNEEYGLKVQLRRAAVSVPSNIAEGQGRQSTGEFLQFLGHARGSLLEAETQILLANRLGYISLGQVEALLKLGSGTARVLNGLISSLGGSRREK